MSAPSVGDPDVSLLDLLDLERIDRDLYRAPFVFADPEPLYGGQVAAQALWAAAQTVPEGRFAHSMHGYFLRAGRTTEPAVFQIHRDRDGGSFSSRRVVALQDGEVIFSMACSFQVDEGGPDQQETQSPAIAAAGDGAALEFPRLFSTEARDTDLTRRYEWPTQFWVRCTDDLEDDRNLHACVLAYHSDASTGLSGYIGAEYTPSSSIDHALWFHRPARADEWLLHDNAPHGVAHGRGWYTGSVFNTAGALVASYAQESLYRRRR